MTMFKLNLWSTWRAIVIGTVMAFGLGALDSAQSQEFPEKTIIKIIVPYAAGGPTDTVARLLLPHMEKALNQTVIIENRTGAGSAIGARVVASAAPDGYTILLGNISTFAIVPAVMKHPGYDPTKAFVPIVQTSDIGNVLVVKPDFPANTVQELIAYAKANPGKISYGSAGVGNSAHLMAELMKEKTGIDIVHVPYRGGGELSIAVLSGQVQMAFTDLSASIGLIRKGQLKALAITSNTRTPEFPDLPTMAEAGFADIVLRNWTGAVAPAGTPPAIVKTLLSAINEGLASPEVQANLKKIGAETKPGTSEELARLIASDFKKWSEVAKAAGISID
jgi:tripartite-type tricarboxylate transporter receptor subunit TctC